MRTNVIVNYIATGKYAKYTHLFLKNIHLLFPKSFIHVIVRMDRESEEREFPNGLPFEVWKSPANPIHEVTAKIHHTENYPWPLVTTFKFKRIKEAILLAERDLPGLDFQYVVNLDATTFPNREISEYEFLHPSRICAVNHFAWYPILAAGGKEELVDTFWAHYDNSVAWRDSRKIEFQAFPGFLSAPLHIAKQMCDEIAKMCETDLKHNVMPYFHDESYYNKYLDNHLDQLHLINDAVVEDDDETTHWNATAMWRVASYGTLQEEKKP